MRRILVNTYASWWRRKWNGERPTDQLPETPHGDDGAGEPATRGPGERYGITVVGDRRDRVREAVLFLYRRVE